MEELHETMKPSARSSVEFRGIMQFHGTFHERTHSFPMESTNKSFGEGSPHAVNDVILSLILIPSHPTFIQCDRCRAFSVPL